MKKLFKLNINKKMLLGYLPLALVIVVMAVYGLYSLEQVHRLNRSVIEEDIYAVDASKNLLDRLLTQELYGRRFLILKTNDMRNQFYQGGKEFRSLLKETQKKRMAGDSALAQIEALHRKYESEYRSLFYESKKKTPSRFHEDSVKTQIQALTASIHGIQTVSENNRIQRTREAAVIGQTAFRVMALLSIFGFMLGVAAAWAIKRNIIHSIDDFRSATQEISTGKFTDISVMDREDEFGVLTLAFRDMAQELAQLRERYLDSSPLTRLPGGIAIENALKKRLASKEPVAFGLIDLANFKAYNDRYGYAAGNEIIKTTADIIEKSVSEIGNKYDLKGHIGGDDFAVITTPDKIESIAQKIIREFDGRVVGFYNTEDRGHGYITAKSRQGQVVQFPIMTIAVASVVSMPDKPYNHIEMGEIAAEMKEYAKTFGISKFVIDRRGKKRKEEDKA